MTTVREVLVGAGYGTDEWVEMAKREAEDIAQAIDQLVEESGIVEEKEERRWRELQLQKRYEDLRQEYRDFQNEAKEKDEQIKKLSATLTKDE